MKLKNVHNGFNPPNALPGLSIKSRNRVSSSSWLHYQHPASAIQPLPCIPSKGSNVYHPPLPNTFVRTSVI